MMTRATIRSLRIPRLCALALIAVAATVSADQTGYYRWKDDKGQFQATQQPPTDRPSEYIKLSTGRSLQMAPGETVENKEQAEAKAGAAAKKGTGAMQGVPDKDPEKCKQAQDTRSVLDSHARIREKTEEGEYRYLTPEEIAEQKRRATESVEVFCDPAK